MERVAIIGLGYVGSSIGYSLRLKKRNRPEVVGFDFTQKVQQKAEKTGAIDRGVWGMPDAVRDADLVVLATPVIAMRELFQGMAPHLMPDVTVTDTSTSMREVTAWANEFLPRSAGFVGGHPLVSGNGIENATGDAFEGAQWAVAPKSDAPPQSVRTVVQFVERMGAKPFFVDVEEHDSYVAAASHLPIVLSSALMLGAARSPSWHEISRFAGDDFREVSRCARINPEVNFGSLVGNRDMVVHWIDQVMQELADFRTMLAEHDETDDREEQPLSATLNDAWEARLRWEAGIRPPGIERPELPTSGDMTMTMFMGDRIVRRFKEMTRREEE